MAGLLFGTLLTLRMLRKRNHATTPIAYLFASITLAIAWSFISNSYALAQDYPTRTVRILTNSSAGGTYDIFARALASELNNRWGQAVIVEPRPGGNFMIAGRACADADPDGYTLCALSGET